MLGGKPRLPDPVIAEGERAGEEASVRTPWNVIGIMVLANLFFTADELAMQKDVTGVATCTGLWWTFALGVYPVVGVGVWAGARSLRQLVQFHEDRGEFNLQGEVSVTGKMLIVYPAVTGLVGLVAGLLGLGGGEFLVPLLLEMGLQTTVASATSGFIMLFTTSSNIVHYAVAGTLDAFLGYSVCMFVVAFSGGLIGLSIRDRRYMRRNTHYVVFVLAGLLITGGVLLLYRGFPSMRESESYRFQAFCPS